MTVYSAILHDSYTDEDGNETPYEDKIIAVQKKDGDFKCASLPDFDTFNMLNEAFFKKCTDIKVIFE